jgi:hypothetical protein
MTATQPCSCDPKDVNPSRDFYATGKIHSFIVLNLRDYVTGIEKMDFERLRGGEAFADVLRKLAPSHGFVEDEEERETAIRAHDFQVFRGHLTEHWLFPTFHLQKELVEPPDDVPPQEWENHGYHVRLSRTGFIEIRITRELPQDGEAIVDILQSQLELAARGELESRSLLIKLAMHCANLFVRALPDEITIHEQNSNEKVMFSFQEVDRTASLPYRQRYMTMFLSGIHCRKCGKRLEAIRLRDQYPKALAAILEGVLVEEEPGRLTLPDMDSDRARVIDLASWQDDLCVFSPERALIYYPQKRIYLFGQAGTEAVPYERYWECIMRGIEHTVTVRAAMQIIEYETTKHLDIVPALTKKVVDGSVTKADKEEISQMSQEVANTFNMLPLLRDVLVPTSSYRAGYAIKKFEHLTEVLNIKDIEGHVDQNVQELVTFVQFFASMKLDDELNRVGVLLGVVALAVAGPSFLSDYDAFFVQRYGFPQWTELFVTIIFAAVAITLIALLLAPEWLRRVSHWIRPFVRQVFTLRAPRKR